MTESPPRSEARSILRAMDVTALVGVLLLLGALAPVVVAVRRRLCRS